MLERAGMSDRIKSVMGLIRRHESLFQLPTRIVQETERGEFETVCSSCHAKSVQTLIHGSFPCIMWDSALHARLAALGYRLCVATVDFSLPVARSMCHQLLQRVFGTGFKA